MDADRTVIGEFTAIWCSVAELPLVSVGDVWTLARRWSESLVLGGSESMRTSTVAISLLLCATAPAVSALDHLDVPTAMQWFMPLLERPTTRVASAWGIEQSSRIRDRQSTMGRHGGFASLSTRAWRGLNEEIWIRAALVEAQTTGDATLPMTGMVPARLQDVRLGGFWRRQADDGTIYGIDAQVSSPSDRPFSQREVVNNAATAFARLPTDGADAWLLLLRYDSSSEVLAGAPLPGVGYQWIRPTVRATLGIPFAMIDVQLGDGLTLSASYFLVDTGNLTLRWSPDGRSDSPGRWATSTGLSMSNEQWWRADRSDADVRLGIRTARAFLAQEWKPRQGTDIRLAVGRVLMRETYEVGRDDDRSSNHLYSEPAWYGSLSVRCSF